MPAELDSAGDRLIPQAPKEGFQVSMGLDMDRLETGVLRHRFQVAQHSFAQALAPDWILAKHRPPEILSFLLQAARVPALTRS